MHPALNIVTFGLLSLHLQGKEEKRAEKRAKAEAKADAAAEAAPERLQSKYSPAEHCAEIERRFQAAVPNWEAEYAAADQQALRAEEQRRRDDAQKAKEQAEDLEFSKNPSVYIAAHFVMLHTIMQKGVYIITFDFNHLGFGSIDQHLTGFALHNEFGVAWKRKALSSRAICAQMDECLGNAIWDNATAGFNIM